MIDEVKVIPPNDYGFSTVDDHVLETPKESENTGHKLALEKSEKKLDDITNVIVNFLDKLAEDPAKTTLKWPNRAEITQKLKNDILKLKNS